MEEKILNTVSCGYCITVSSANKLYCWYKTYARNYENDCNRCNNTALHPIPFSEVL